MCMYTAREGGEGGFWRVEKATGVLTSVVCGLVDENLYFICF